MNGNDAPVRLSLDTPQRSLSLIWSVPPQLWIRDANCLGTDPEAFFPEKGGSTKAAKAVCARCTVQAECLDFAQDNDDRFGIWGGLSERERRRLGRDPSMPSTSLKECA